MLNFTISNLETARDLIIVGNYNKILSIVDSQKEPYFYFGKKVFNYYEANKDAIDWHVSQFDDMEMPFQPKLCNRYKWPSRAEIRKILDFNMSINASSDRVLFHCMGGISRSTAIAILTLAQCGMKPAEALGTVVAAQPRAWPNTAVLKIGSELLGVDCLRPVLKWRNDLLLRDYIVDDVSEWMCTTCSKP